jgi:hypothetical protein
MFLNLFVAVFTFLVFVVFLECYFRFVSDFRYYSPRVFTQSDHMPWTLLPGSQDSHYGYYGDFKVKIRINKEGFRGHDLQMGQKRNILFLGDSFTFGYGVENDQVFMNVLERKLANSGLSLINCGFADGYSPDLYYLFLKKQLSYLSPELVIIGICAANDISDMQYNEWADNNLSILKIKCSRFYVDGNHRLRDNPEYGLGGKFFTGSKKTALLPKVKAALRDNSYLLNFVISRIRMANFKNKNQLDFNVPKAVLSESDAKQRFAMAVSKIRDLLNENKIGSLFILIPSKEDFAGASGDFAYIDNYMSQNKYAYLNLLTEFKKRGLGPDKIYFRYDGHWNSYGHSVVGAILYDYFKGSYQSY